MIRQFKTNKIYIFTDKKEENILNQQIKTLDVIKKIIGGLSGKNILHHNVF